MLPKKKRLNLKKDFKWVAQGKKLETTHLKLFLRFGNNSLPLIGIAVSSSSFSKAHERSRAKRLVAQAIIGIYQVLPKGTNLVIMPKQTVLDKKPAELKEEIKSEIFTD